MAKRLTRRHVLAMTAASTPIVAGCQGDEPAQGTERTPETSEPTRTRSTSQPTATPPADGPNIATTYQPGHGEWDECMSGTPTVGRYEVASGSVAEQHRVAFRTGRITRVRVRAPRSEGGRRRLRPVLDTEGVQVDVTANVVRTVTDGASQEFLSEIAELSAAESAVTGVIVPVNTLRRDDAAEVRARIRDQHGSLPAFGDWLRDQLPESRVIAQVGRPSLGAFNRYRDEYTELLGRFDGVTNSVWPPRPSQTPWAVFEGAFRVAFQELTSLADRTDIEVEPTVAPGLPTGVDACTADGPRAVPRDPDAYEQVLRLGLQYATDERVTVASFNDWRRGTQLEPGSYDGTQYGEEYLKRTRRVHDDPPEARDRETYFVAPDGDNSGQGSREDPFESIQHALTFAQPGETVHVLPGRYREHVTTVRPGEPGDPITITGPPEAVYLGGNLSQSPEPLKIRHSHVHVTGLTFDGLQHPDRADDLEAYAGSNLTIDPLSRWTGEGSPPMVTDVKLLPHAVGNTQGPCMHVFFGDDVEVGACRLHGPAGVAHFVFDEPGHDGEIVYIGTSQGGWDGRWDGHVDRTRNVHVHHIDASTGYKHAELADAKPGTENVLVEYCTSVNSVGGQPAIHLGGSDGVARWNRIENSESDGITIGNWGAEDERTPDAGTGNAVYGNRIRGSGNKAVNITSDVSAADQRVLCGNDIEGTTDGKPAKSCPSDVPAGDGIGHTGGDSP